MIRLVDRIERAMYSVNPFGYTMNDGGNYYYEANNMMDLLHIFKLSDSIIDLCMDSFQIYNDGHEQWVQLAEKIEHILRQQICGNRTKYIKSELTARVGVLSS